MNDRSIQGQLPIAETARAAMRDLLDRHDPMDVARLVGVHNAHVYRCRKSGHISPTLRAALIDGGFVPRPERRYRLHYEGGRGDGGRRRVEEVQRKLDDLGYDNLTEYVDKMLEVD